MSSKNRIFDVLTVLEDGAGTITESAAGSNASIDLGGGGQESVGPQLPVNAEVELDVSTLDFTAENETYEAKIQVSNSATFDSGVVDVNQRDVVATGKYNIPVTNEVNGTVYRYMRIYFTLGGTTPIILCTACLTKH